MSSCKYYKQKKQVSYDSGQTWSDVSPAEYQVGELYEVDSIDCQGELLIRWVEIPDGFLCENKNKYALELGEYSVDEGVTFNSFSPPIYQLGRLLESNSEICNNKWEGYYRYNSICPSGYAWIDGRGCVKIQHQQAHVVPTTDPVKYVRCSSSTSTTLTRDDVTYSPYDLYKGFIGECVTEISSDTFASASSLVSITIPETVQTIGDSAFYNCTSLTSINIPSGVTSINFATFLGCSSLSSVTIPDSVTSINARAFEGCNSLTSITIPSGVTNIGMDAFACTGLTSITVEATTPPSIYHSGFDSTNCPIYVPCSSIQSYISASGWSDYAFRIQGIPPCEQPTGKKMIATIGGSEPSTYEIPCDYTGILTSGETHSDFQYYNVTDIIIGDCVTEISAEAFVHYSTLSSATIPNSVTVIGESVFNGCTGLASIDIPSGVTNIGSYAFYNCRSLTSIEIPKSVRTISGYAFSNCIGLTSIIVNRISPPTLGSYAFYQTNNCPIYVPAESVNTYKSTSRWSSYASRIQAIPTQ